MWLTILVSAGITWSVWISSPSPAEEVQMVAFVILTLAASLAQMFPVKTPKYQAYSATIAIIFAGVLLLDYHLLAALIIAAHIPEWVKTRQAWHIPLFNISAFVIASTVARIVFTLLLPPGAALLSEAGVVAISASALTLTVLNHVLVAYALVLTRGIAVAKSGVFSMESLATDLVLICFGATAAAVWQISIWLLPITLAPLVLAHRALGVPRLQEEVRIEPKTGLYNAKYFSEVLSNEIRRHKRLGLNLSVAMADLDLLRSVNNTFGHLAGDDVVATVARILKEESRQNDVVARFGGEEFVILLPETDSAAAFHVAERIRLAIAAAEVRVRNSQFPIHVTVSLGIASFPEDGHTADVVMHQADLAVYWAKVNGRNRSCVASSATRELDTSKAAEPHPQARYVRSSAALDAGAGQRINSTAGNSAVAMGASWPAIDCSALARVQSALRSAISGLKIGAAMPWPLAALILVEASAAMLLEWRYLPDVLAGRVDLVGVMVLAAIGAAAELFSVDIYAHETSVSTSIVASTAAAFLFGPMGVAVVSLVLAVTLWVAHRSQLSRFLFNFGNLTISGMMAAAAFHAFGQPVNASSLHVALFPTVVAGAVNYLMSTWSVALAVALTSKQSAVGVWAERYRWIFPHYLMLGVLGLIVGAAYNSLGISGVLAFVAPPLMMRFALKQYVDKTEGMVTELRQTNDRLRATQDSLVSALRNVEESYHSTLEALSAALERHDKESSGHSRRVVGYTDAIARRMSLPEGMLKELQRGALLHDLGKIGVPWDVLNKIDPLLPEEWAQIRKHPRWGFEIVSEIPFLKSAALVVLHHHERYDGRGYPDGLAGDDIPLGARIFAIADALDAMTSGRPYRAGIPLSEGLEEVEKNAGKQFDPAAVAALMQVPMGELLEISRAKGLDAPSVEPAFLKDINWNSTEEPDIAKASVRFTA